MSTKLIKGIDQAGNEYYSDMPVKSTNATLDSIVSSGSIVIIRAGRVVTLVIRDIKVSSNINTRTQIASGLPKGYSWGMFTTLTNQGTSIFPILFFDGNGGLFIEGSNFTTSHRMLGSYTYITKD